MILLDLVCSQKLNSYCGWLLWLSSWEELLNCIKGFIFAASILGLCQLFASRGLRSFSSRISSYSFTWALALSIACSCKVNRSHLWSSYVEWCFAEKHLQAFWTAVPYLVQVWNKAGLPRPFTRLLVCFVCKKPRTDGLSVTACGKAAASFNSQEGGLFLMVGYPYFL